MSAKPTAYILVGVPGSGKSTWVEKQARAGKLKDFMLCSTDDYIERYANLHQRTYSEVFDQCIKVATSKMMDDVDYAKEKSLDIVWDQTNVSIKTRANKIRLLKDYRKVAVVFTTPEKEELQTRLASRPGKNIPDFVMNSMISNFVMPTLAEGFDEVTLAIFI